MPVAVIDKPGAVKSRGGGSAVNVTDAEKRLRIIDDLLPGCRARRVAVPWGRVVLRLSGLFLGRDALLLVKLSLHIGYLAGNRRLKRLNRRKLAGIFGRLGIQACEDGRRLRLLWNQVRLLVLIFRVDNLLRGHLIFHVCLRVFNVDLRLFYVLDQVAVVFHDFPDIVDTAQKILKTCGVKEDGIIGEFAVFLHGAYAGPVSFQKVLLLLLVFVQLVFHFRDWVCVDDDLLWQIIQLLVRYFELLVQYVELLCLGIHLIVKRVGLGLNILFLIRKGLLLLL